MVNATAGYSAGQAAKAVGLSYRNLDYWARTGLVEPSVGAEGTGTARMYTFGDLIALRAVKRLRDAGISVQSIRKVVERIQTMTASKKVLADRYLVAAEGDVVEVNGSKLLSWLKKPGQNMFYWVLDLGAVNDEVVFNIKSVQKPARGPASKVG